MEDEAKSVASSISQKERTGRVDYRDVFTLTIDPLDARDFDDALSLKKLTETHGKLVYILRMFLIMLGKIQQLTGKPEKEETRPILSAKLFPCFHILYPVVFAA